MKIQIPQAVTITANQMEIAASIGTGDWHRKKYQRKRIKAYGELNRKVLTDLGARIKQVMN